MRQLSRRAAHGVTGRQSSRQRRRGTCGPRPRCLLLIASCAADWPREGRLINVVDHTPARSIRTKMSAIGAGSAFAAFTRVAGQSDYHLTTALRAMSGKPPRSTFGPHPDIRKSATDRNFPASSAFGPNRDHHQAVLEVRFGLEPQTGRRSAEGQQPPNLGHQSRAFEEKGVQRLLCP